MRLTELGLLYLVVGVGCALVVLLKGRRQASPARRALDAGLLVAFWPLYGPFLVQLDWEEPAATSPQGNGAVHAFEDALRQARNTPLAELLPDPATARRLAERLASVERRLDEVDTLLTQPDLDEAAALRRHEEFEARGDERAAASVLGRIQNIRRLATLRRRFAQELDEIEELLAQRTGLRMQDVTAGFHHLRVRFEEPAPGPLLLTRPSSPNESKSNTEPTPTKPSPSLRKPNPKSSSRRKELRPAKKLRLERLPRPERGQKPTLLRVGPHSWPLRSWRDIQIVLCNHLAEAAPDAYRSAMTAPELSGRKRRYLAATSEQMHTPKPVPGGFVEVNLSAENTIALAERLLRFCGIDLGTVSYEV